MLNMAGYPYCFVLVCYNARLIYMNDVYTNSFIKHAGSVGYLAGYWMLNRVGYRMFINAGYPVHPYSFVPVCYNAYG